MFKPRWFARVAFIGNLFFLACILLQYKAAPGRESQLISLVAILGLVLGMGIFNPVSNLINLVMLIRRQRLFAQVPQWLAFANLLFLVSQIIYILHIWS